MVAIGVLTAGPAALVVATATALYWVISWLVAGAWRFVYEASNFPKTSSSCHGHYTDQAADNRRCLPAL